MLEEQVAKRAARGRHANRHAALDRGGHRHRQRRRVKPPEAKKIDVGTVAALGVAVGAIGAFATALVGYATGIFKLGALATLAAFAGLLCSSLGRRWCSPTSSCASATSGRSSTPTAGR